MQKVSPKFDEIKIGDAVVERIEITEGLVDRYITLSGDSSEIHQCLEAAHDAGFLGRVVHGTLISSFFSMLIGTRLPGHNALLLEIKCKFHLPAIVGDIISVEAVIIDKHFSVECVTLKLIATRADGQKLCSGEALVKIRST